MGAEGLIAAACLQEVCACCGGTDPRKVVSVEVPNELFRVLLYPLCARCWVRRSPAERLKFFRKLWLDSGPGPEDLGTWLEIEQAVLEAGR